jgi:hypothetical protein
MATIVEILVQPVTVRFNGVDEQVLEMRDLWKVRQDNITGQGDINAEVLSNPLLLLQLDPASGSIASPSPDKVYLRVTTWNPPDETGETGVVDKFNV